MSGRLVEGAKDATLFLNMGDAGRAATAYFRAEGRSMTPAHAVVLSMFQAPPYRSGAEILVEIRHMGAFAGYLARDFQRR